MIDQNELFDILQTKKPLSVVRAGDGEVIVLESFKSIEAYETCINLVMKRQMGYEPILSEVRGIRKNLVEAYSGADIVGIPNQSNLAGLNEFWVSAKDVIKPLCTTDKFTSTDVFYQMLESGLLDKWLTGSKVINYISCRNLTAKLAKRYQVNQVNHYRIAPEYKFTSGDFGRHYPDQFNRVQRWMTKCSIAGNPCLVGAGVIGKIYCNWFRDRGGVAVDLGAVFDSWAGYSTRGPARGLGAEDNKYKL